MGFLPLFKIDYYPFTGLQNFFHVSEAMVEDSPFITFFYIIVLRVTKKSFLNKECLGVASHCSTNGKRCLVECQYHEFNF